MITDTSIGALHVHKNVLRISVNSMDDLNALLSKAERQVEDLRKTIREISNFGIEIKFDDVNKSTSS